MARTATVNDRRPNIEPVPQKDAERWLFESKYSRTRFSLGNSQRLDIKLLTDSMIRQTTVLIAQLSVTAGVRAPLVHLADEVFLTLSAELANGTAVIDESALVTSLPNPVSVAVVEALPSSDSSGVELTIDDLVVATQPLSCP